ncbi:GNAT family N-acetyltransferase [Actinokineospora diospyrosa]|uniref:Acetyltransferase (GNAT) domain-containing protein n=1 Tax=Actinokineospora diospyrosa TaxID=103728 RepID=A0ABT1IHE2_9PSEU|nr:GNAT family N-acetyltransferase [Actinokineospora diospyrosa]MCP2272068.1 Acetyltransferase (GNAT) domain-containing protein [Actinokineospora diospyrosa]
MDVAEIEAEHAARVHALDPLLPAPPPLAPGAGHLLTSTGGAAIAWPQRGLESDPWGPLRRHLLEVRLARPDALGDLLDQWFDLIHSSVEPGDLECAAVVEVPSRDTEGVFALVQRGFVPVSVAAARMAGRGLAGPADVLVRPAEPADLATVLELAVAVVEYDAPFGKITPRPAAIEALRDQMAGLLATPDPRIWVGCRDGEVLGSVYVQLPPESAWCARYTSVPGPAYLASMSVRADQRGSGVGTALAAHAHAVMDAGAPLTLLHHALPNPRSTPFWYRNGYRPLWTTWMRRPILR